MEAPGPQTVMDAIYTVRTLFLRNGLKPPVVIELESNDEGMRFLGMIRHECPPSMQFGKPYDVIQQPDGSLRVEVEGIGMKVRWPGRIMRREDGGTFVF